jgi:long-chain acyl-CoA synthetase
VREFCVPPVVTIGATATLTDPVWENAEIAPDTVQFARRIGTEWRDVTCAEFRSEVVALARGLLAAGLEPGQRVALMSRTRYEWTLIDYAIWACGAVTVPIYDTSSAEQVSWILSNSGAVACFVETAQHREIVANVADDLPDLDHVWCIEPPAPGRPAVDELVADGAAVPREDVEKRRIRATADDIATIIYTSGTTGRPKGCVLTHRNLYADVANAVPKLPSLFNEGASTLLFLPLAHAFARLIQLGVVQARARMGHLADVKNLVADLQLFQPTFILSVPRVFEKVYNTAKQRAHADGKGAIFDRADRVAVAVSEARNAGRQPGLVLRAEQALFDRLVYGKLRQALGGRCTHAISGGAPLGARLAHFYRGVGITVYEGYGLTETAPASAANVDDAVRIGTVGRPLPGVTIRISDDGEVLIKGDHVFRGYWNDEAATAEVLDPDGWFRTGDLGELDDDGFLTITGRKKELIVTASGKNVAPAVLEDRIRIHPLVSQSVVVGDRQPFIAALITIDPEALTAWNSEHGKPAETTAAELRDDPELRAEIGKAIEVANRAVSKAESIRTFRILPHDFTESTGELTPSMKVKRNVVLKAYADEIASIYQR